MAIRFSCDCGQTITARSEYAGRKVQSRRCVRNFRNDQPWLPNLSADNLYSDRIRIVKMVVHPNESRNHRIVDAI